jgi:hypothetical protein
MNRHPEIAEGEANPEIAEGEAQDLTACQEIAGLSPSGTKPGIFT